MMAADTNEQCHKQRNKRRRPFRHSLRPHSMLSDAGWGKIPDVINLFLNIESVEHIANAVQVEKQIY